MNDKKNIIIIDFHLGNLFSVKQACDKIGMNAKISSDINEINNADALILPGVGAFIEAMQNLNNLNLVNPIKAAVESGKPLFGVCLGLQLLFTTSEEFGSGNGLNLIPGIIKKFPNTVNNKIIKVPQIQWNKIYPLNMKWLETPLSDIKPGEFLYFVHSYFVEPVDDKFILSKTNYEGVEYCSSVIKKNIFAVQFHPEKSAQNGLSIYKNWATLNNLI